MAGWDIIRSERTQAKAHAYNFTLWPRLWEMFNNSFSYSWAKQLFKKSVMDEIPARSGIYTFVIEPRIANHPSCAFLVYVGKTDNLKRRFGEYIEVQEGKRRHSPLLEQALSQHLEKEYLFFYYSFHAKDSLKLYEQALIDGFVPPWNDKKTISSSIGNIVRAFQ
jgi:hypothetical protein